MAERAPSALGPPPILTQPSGYLGFLGLKSGGKQPEFVTRDLVPVMDMFGFYRAGARQVLQPLITQAAAQNAGSTSNTITVPSGRMWIIDAMSSFSDVLGVAANCYGQFYVQDPTGNNYYFGPPSQKGLTGERIALSFLGQLLLPGGFTVRMYTSAPAAITAFNWNTAIFGSEVIV